jgi:hypothetical protein
VSNVLRIVQRETWKTTTLAGRSAAPAMHCHPIGALGLVLLASACTGNIMPYDESQLGTESAMSADDLAEDQPTVAVMSAGQTRDEKGHRVPERLSQTGLYSDISSQSIAPGRRFYRPQFELWSDHAEKSRWIYLPPGTQIDNSDADHWSFPVGTQVWKEFRIDGRPIETRLVQRMGSEPDDFMYATYQWRPDGSDADYISTGVTNASGTGHDIPSSKGCVSCHTHLPEHVLGFSALLLSTNFEGVTLRTLDAEGLLTVPEPTDHVVPGDATAQSALGYLHSNCGSCHNQASGIDAPLTGVQLPNRFSLRLGTGQTTVGTTDTCLTGLSVPMSYSQAGSVEMRVVGGGPEVSGIYHRTALRGGLQMPPLATKVIDPDGLTWISAWIGTLPRPGEGDCSSLR